MSLDKLHADAARASQAHDLLNSDLLNEAFTTLEAEYIAFWRKTHVDDDKGREKLFLAVNLISKVRKHLETVLSDGVLAKRELEDLIARPKKEWSQI